MRETICTIPVNEVFEVTGGCPICRLRDILEAKHIDYITGAAMMEPDVRIMTNQKGFCERHFNAMLDLGRQRLPICLTMETHIGEIGGKLLKSCDSGSLKRLEQLENSCFVCDMIEHNLSRFLDTVYRSYRNEPEFRALFAGQEYICLPHYRRMVAESKKTLGPLYGEFCDKALGLARARCQLLEKRLKGFEDAFDHRNAGVPMAEEYRDSLECAVEFITSRDPRARK